MNAASKPVVKESIDAGASDVVAVKAKKARKPKLLIVQPVATESGPTVERLILNALFAHLADAGFPVSTVSDGERVWRPTTAAAAIDLVEVADQVIVTFRAGTERHGVFLVPGNGAEMIGNWSFDEGDADGFNAAMLKFDAEVTAA